MRKFTAMMMAVSFVVLTAGFAVADVDVAVDVRNNINATGGNANQRQDQQQGQQQDQRATAVVRGNLPTVGFAGFLTSGTPIPGTEWKFFYSKLYSRLSVKKIGNMKYGFRLSDLWPSNWGGRVQFTMMGESLSSNSDDVLMMSYWPLETPAAGDEVLATAIVVGEPNWADEAFIGDAVDACKEKTMTRRVAMAFSESYDGVTVGASVGGSGLTSKVSGGGESGVAFAGGGMLGKNRTRTEKIRMIKVLCMNDGPIDFFGKSSLPAATIPSPEKEQASVAPKTTATKSAPANTCNTDEIWEKIKELKQEVRKCTRYCFNNLTLRSALGEAYIDLYTCTGDAKYLKEAIYNYEVAERNYKFGHDIKSHPEATQVINQVYYNQAGCIWVTQGEKAAKKFGAAKHLERIPTGFVR